MVVRTAVLAVFAVMAVAPVAPALGASPAARVGDDVIDMEELEKPLRARLAQIEQQRFELLQQRLDQLVAERLIAQEARRRGTTPEQLLRDEVDAKTAAVTDGEVAEFMTENRARLPRGDEAELRGKVRDYLRSQRVGERRQAYVEALRDKTPVTIYLEESPAARIEVRADKGFARGPADAAIVIVEFSDFQCPYCKGAVATVKQVLGRYPEKVRWVFRDFPIEQIHPDAPRAHEAARCAGAQGKFWEYHDLLFERAPRLSRADLQQYAGDLELDTAAFAECLDSARFAAAVAADIEEGSELGVSGTPTFYVNGRPLVGAQPFQAFRNLIESELSRKAAR